MVNRDKVNETLIFFVCINLFKLVTKLVLSLLLIVRSNKLGEALSRSAAIAWNGGYDHAPLFPICNG